MGMAPNPISYLEIEAYERAALILFSAWETDLLVRMDDAARLTVAKSRPKPAGDQGSSQIPVSNPGGIRSMFRGMAARLNPKPKE